MLGDGLQGTLLAIRADLEGFSATLTGLVMSTFYLGFLLGSILTPRITIKVGHIRVFAAFAAVSSAAILIHALVVSVPMWMAMRLLSGFCFAGLLHRGRKLAERSSHQRNPWQAAVDVHGSHLHRRRFVGNCC